MSIARTRARPFTLPLLLVACAESAPTAPAPIVGDSLDLTLFAPIFDRSDFVAEGPGEWDPSFGPPRTSEPPPPEPEYPDAGTLERYDAAADIWGESTRVSFVPGSLALLAEHSYQGNMASISSTATVLHQGQVVGTQSGEHQEAWPFILDFGMPHHIWHTVRAYTQKDCGFSGHGESRHRAWWQAVAGGPVFEFNQVGRSSQSDHEFQPVCPPSGGPTGGGGGTYSGDQVICHYWVEYDMATGEILDSFLMYCTEGG